MSVDHPISPPRCLITTFPGLLDVPKPPFHGFHCLRVTRVFADVVTDLHRMPSAGHGELDHDVERHGLLPVRVTLEIIWVALVSDSADPARSRTRLARLTRQESSHAERWLEAGLFGQSLVFQTQLDVERIGKDDRFLIL